MARAWRIEYEGALYHVLSRGNERCHIVVDDKDRNLFLDTVGEMSQRFEVDICAYVLMDNHYHLLIRTKRANLSKSMQWLGATYTRRFNLRYFRSGHLFQGRFKYMLVQNDAYLKYSKEEQRVWKDLRLYLMWHTGQLTNLQIAEKFGLTYSAVSRRVGVFKDLLRKSKPLQNKFNRIKSLIKI